MRFKRVNIMTQKQNSNRGVGKTEIKYKNKIKNANI